MQALYRLFDSAGTLLYVGISLNVAQRMSQHRAVKPWWDDVASIQLATYPDRASVLEAERAAITNEHPLHNILGKVWPTAVEAGPSGRVLDRLAVSSAKRKQLVAEREEARTAEREAIVAVLGAGMKQVQVCSITGFTREHVRRLALPAKEQSA